MALLLFSLGGCFRGKLPARELYRLRLPQNADTSPIADHESRVASVGSLAIAPYLAPGMYGNRSIVYRVGESEYGSYANREWALPVPTMLGMITEDLLRTRPLTAEPAIFDPPSPHAYTYIWRGTVRELEEVDRGRTVYAAIQLDARLVRAADDSVIWRGTTRLERAVPEGTMPAIVLMLSQLAAEGVTQLVEAARPTLAATAASAVPPRSLAAPRRP
jgi:ABC-type uncharacterized transport system auxiliary subunit